MAYSEFYINSKDGTRLFYRRWSTKDTPAALIIFVHGFGEHSGRYNHWAEKFNHTGMAMTAVDYRGHGKADGKRGHTGSMKLLMDDIQVLIEQSVKDFPGIPCFLYGHSMGGNLVLNYHLRRDANFFKGIISGSPWLKLAFEAPKITVILGKILVTIFPAVVTETNLVVEQISHDPVVQRAYRSDPLVHGYISLKLFDVITKGGIFVLQNYNRLKLPVLLMHGTADMITSYKASLYLGYKARQVISFKAWPGLFHELHNEFEKDEVFNHISQWINLQMQR